MKLINLNVGIKLNNTKKVGDFLREEDSDIVTLQEVIRHLEDKVFEQYQSKKGIESMLSNKYPYHFFGPLWVTEAFLKNGEMHRDFGGLIEQGNEILSKFPILGGSSEHYYKHYEYARDWTKFKSEDHGRALQIAEIDVSGKVFQILNFHGIWTEDKRGDKRTQKQCAYIAEAAKRKNLPTIIVGDFNLLPDAQSLDVLNKEFRNLITEYNITKTRPDFKDALELGNTVVDYVFVNDQVEVCDFRVIETDVSDHLPLILEFK
jgi:endonuclease/exonuclease/phosphatase family metal-dependent hydrolase